MFVVLDQCNNDGAIIMIEIYLDKSCLGDQSVLSSVQLFKRKSGNNGIICGNLICVCVVACYF
jgi:hypothetical protein